MFLANALTAIDVADLDPARSLRLGPFDLGPEATSEAIRILGGGDFPRNVSITERNFAAPVYWHVAHQTEGEAEIFGFPADSSIKFSTALEIALVRAIAGATPDHHDRILGGGAEVAIGAIEASSGFRRILGIAPPLCGSSLLFGGATEAIISEHSSSILNNLTINCMINSFFTSPLKYRFLELYRVMEAKFIADIKLKLDARFATEPGVALADGLEALKSEMNQLAGLAETEQEAFEACWVALDQLRNTNRFAAALFRKADLKRAAGKGKDIGGLVPAKAARAASGAALIYHMRCAVVHAGEKDIIFDNFPDGEAVIDALMPFMERASLLLVGVKLVENELNDISKD